MSLLHLLQALFLSGVPAVSEPALQVPDPRQWEQSLSLWLTFNGTLAVRHANLSTVKATVHGTPVVYIAAAETVGGVAALLGAGTTISIPAPCVLPWGAATVMGWWRLSNGTSAGELFRLGNQELAMTGPAGKAPNLCLMSGGVTPGSGWKWMYLCKAVPTLLASQWTHLAITWDSAGKQQLFVNGALLGTQQSPHTPLQGWGVSDALTLGSGAAVSQLTAWADVLDNTTIAVAAKTPMVFDTQLDRDTPGLPSANSSLGHEIQLQLATSIPVDLPTSSIIDVGETVALDINLLSSSLSDTEVTIRLGVWDVWDQPMGETESMVATVAPNSSAVVRVSLAGAKRGVFRVAASVFSRRTNQLLDQRDVGSFAVWPAPDTTQPCRSGFFGSHVNAWSGGLFVNQSMRLGQCGGQRDHDMLQASLFNEVEPSPGDFAFAGDTQMEHFLRNGIPVLGSLAGTPAWASNNSAAGGLTGTLHATPRTADVPKPALFRAYVKAVAQHYSSIKAFELWNEPSQGVFFSGTPEEYAALARIASAELKAVDPEALLVVGGFTATEVDWQLAAARAGALVVADVISFHFASDVPPHAAGGFSAYLEELEALIARFRGLAANTTHNPNPRLWNTEGGTMDTSLLANMPLEVGLPPPQCLSPPSYTRGAQSVVQAEAAMQYLGLEKHFIYLQNGEQLAEKSTLYENTNMLDVNNSPRPKLISRLNFAAQTDGAVLPPILLNATTLPSPSLWAFVFAETHPERSLGKVYPQGTTVMVWMETATQSHAGMLQATWPGAVRAVDMMGNPVRAEPLEVSASHVFVHVETSDVAAVQNALCTASCSGCT